MLMKVCKRPCSIWLPRIFPNCPTGNMKLRDAEFFARVNTYATEAKECKRPESHNKYIDVQFLGRGSEAIWYVSKNDSQVITEDRTADDLLFYADAGEKNCVHLQAGDFAVFFPWELHRPGCSSSRQEEVQKIVVKVLAK